jgi:hypothetical protein
MKTCGGVSEVIEELNGYDLHRLLFEAAQLNQYDGRRCQRVEEAGQ